MDSKNALANRLGFLLLGLTNNFAYVIMLAAAFDLLKQPTNNQTEQANVPNNSTSYCNPLSTSTILLADIIPSFVIKLSYPILLLSIPTAYKVGVVSLLSGLSFLVTGFATSKAVIFLGVICASFSSGLGESTFLTSTPSYGNVSLSGWSMGTGAAGLLGAIVYAVLRMITSIEVIMIIMLVIPTTMIMAYSCVIRPVEEMPQHQSGSATASIRDSGSRPDEDRSLLADQQVREGEYGSIDDGRATTEMATKFGYHEKLRHLPKLAKYFFPLLLVYFSEYFINQGLFELMYFSDMKQLDHASQYSWFQVSYQLGVLISRSSLDLFTIKKVWIMSLLQFLNAILILSHVAKIIQIPNFYLVIVLIIYEGLLGGFTYTNTFYRLKNEVPRETREFSMGVVTIADTLGIVSAALVALPVHDALCRLY